MKFAITRRRLLQALAASALLSAGAAAARPRAPGGLGYLPWWMAAGWRAMPWQRLDRLVLFDAPIQPDGGLDDRDWPRRAAALAGAARQAGVPLELALTLMSVEGFNALFSSAARRERLLAGATRLLAQPYLAGLHLDIEAYSAVDAGALAGFRDWLAALDARRRQAGKALSVFLPASDAFAPYDAAAAARIDYWVAQLYDAHWPQSRASGPLVTRLPANPVAVPRALARLSALGVPRAAVLLSVPLYGWAWPCASPDPGAPTRGVAKLLTFAPTPAELMPQDRLAALELARRHGLRRDAELTPYYVHREDGHWVQGWFEDLVSLQAKYGPERAQGYGGLAFFALGYDGGEIVEPMLAWWGR